MTCYAQCSPGWRGFVSKDEKISMLQEYKEDLENESKGVAEMIERLKKESS